MRRLLLLSSLFLSLTPTAHAKKSRDIVVAIIDTGIDQNHPLIQGSLWTNPKEIANGIDDDDNGFVDDLHGWNFVSNNNNLDDNHGHGTHIAGIIEQRAPSPRVKLMILKYYDAKIEGDNLSNTVKAIRYAIKMKADIINYSGGGPERSPEEKSAIEDAQKQGILFIAAAGNDGRNTDSYGYYPASYKISNIISVAAIDSQKRLVATSNYGSHSVDLAAPGKDIYSSLPGGQYGFMSGTSQATAWVTGLAASLMLHFPKPLPPARMKQLLENQGIKDSALLEKTKSRVRISTLQGDISSL